MTKPDEDSACDCSSGAARQMKPNAFLFDAYGTLFDVHSVVLRDAHNIPGDLQALSALWRQKQLEYTWLRSLMERYEDFWDVTEAALRSAVRELKIEASDLHLTPLRRHLCSRQYFQTPDRPWKP